MEYQNNSYENIEHYLMVFKPEKYLPQYIKSTEDIYNFRRILKLIPYSDFCIRYLAEIISERLAMEKKFRKVDCLKVLRSNLRNSSEWPKFEYDTVRLLFSIYKNLFFQSPKKVLG